MASKTISVVKIIALFVAAIVGIRLLQETCIDYLSVDGVIGYQAEQFIRMGFNIVYVLLAYFGIKKFSLFELGGLGKLPFKNWFFLLFPLYIVLLNWPDEGEVLFNEIPLSNYLTLALYTLSVGLSEEFLLRGFLQSFLLKKYGATKKGIVFSVIGGAFIFGLLHLLNFDKGLYGEIGQVCFATFIGVMFGAILLRTRKLYPLIVIHALIDFVAKLDELEPKVVAETVSESTSGIGDMIVIIVITIPCFVYGIILLRKLSVADVQKMIAN